MAKRASKKKTEPKGIGHIIEPMLQRQSEWLVSNGFPDDLHRAVKIAVAELGEFVTSEDVGTFPGDNIWELLQTCVDRRKWLANIDKPAAAVEFVESDYAEPTLKSHLAILFGVDRATIKRRIQSGELRTIPGTLDTAKKVRIHGDDFPTGLKRPNERKQKLSTLPKRGKRQ